MPEIQYVSLRESLQGLQVLHGFRRFFNGSMPVQQESQIKKSPPKPAGRKTGK